MINRLQLIDSLRLYEGDTRRRDTNGNLHGIYTDDFHKDSEAYRTINALLFTGISNEFTRIHKEKHKLNPVYVDQIEETIKMYCNIFSLMCENHKEKDLNWITAKRVERQDSIDKYQEGYTMSFVSSSQNEYSTEFANKAGIVLMDVMVNGNVPFLSFKEILKSEYKYIEEGEILLAPFVKIELKRKELTNIEIRTIKDMNNNPPMGKYEMRAVRLPDYAHEFSQCCPKDILNEVIQKKSIAVNAINDMNCGKRENDYSAYIEWKEKLQLYLKIVLSNIWYREEENG